MQTTPSPKTYAARSSADATASQLVLDYARLAVGDPSRVAARERAITAWLPMAERLAHRYHSRGESLDDLRQTAVIGLIKSIDRFDPAIGTEFVGFAVPTVLGELRRYFRDRAWAIRVPRRLQEMRMAITEASNILSQSLGRWPTVAEIAAQLGTGEEQVIEGLEGGRAYRAVSLSQPIDHDGALQLGDTLGGAEHGYALTELHLALGPAMRCLTDREQQIITARFFGNQTQTQIAEQIGVSQMHISRLLAGALRKLRDVLGPDAG
jgi:RNA polymerase sigma-B factor